MIIVHRKLAILDLEMLLKKDSDHCVEALGLDAINYICYPHEVSSTDALDYCEEHDYKILFVCDENNKFVAVSGFPGDAHVCLLLDENFDEYNEINTLSTKFKEWILINSEEGYHESFYSHAEGTLIV